MNKARAIQETKKGRAGKTLDKRVMMMGCEHAQICKQSFFT